MPPTDSNGGYPLERRTAALLAQSGYFIERNRWFSPERVFEVDIVATRYAPRVSTVLVEATLGRNRSINDAFRLAGQVQFLGYDRGLLVTNKPAPHALRESLRSRVHTDVVSVADRGEDVDERLAAAGYGDRSIPWITGSWLGACEVVDALRQAVRASAKDSPMGARVKARLHAIEHDVWREPDRAKRLAILIASDFDRSLTQRAAVGLPAAAPPHGIPLRALRRAPRPRLR